MFKPKLKLLYAKLKNLIRLTLIYLMAFNVLDSYLLTYLNYSILHFLYIVNSFFAFYAIDFYDFYGLI